MPDTKPPAADAGPRQPLTAERIAEIVRTPLSRQESIAMMTEARDAKHTRKLALSEIPGSMLNDGITEVEVAATAPDRAMRVAARIVLYFRGDDNLPETVRYVAALIREAGSEREWEAFESCAKELREHYNSDWDSTVPGAEFDAEILRILRKHLASRLLGGESNGTKQD